MVAIIQTIIICATVVAVAYITTRNEKKPKKD